MLASDVFSAPGIYVPERFDFQSHESPLTGPSYDAPVDIALNFLRQQTSMTGLADGDLDAYQVTDEYVSPHTGVTHVYLQQTLEGLPVADALINANVTSDGRLLSVHSSFLAGLHGEGLKVEHEPRLTPVEAREALARQTPWELPVPPTIMADTKNFALVRHGSPSEQIPAELQFVPTPDGIELAWRLGIQSDDGQHWYNASVSAASGELLRLVDWVDHARYQVFPLPVESPNRGERTIAVDPHDTLASALGWHDTNGIAGAEFTDTRGNNVYAQEDRNADDSGGSRPSGGADLVFEFPLDLTRSPASYQNAAITNAFYMNNVLHDIFYQYGFTEAAGNFQRMNYSGQGRGRDQVMVDVQDGGWSNNATMATPPEGQSPRMELYLWDEVSPSRDSSLDNGVMIHEYGHGVSNRLTGGPSDADALASIQSGGLGEGWSDWFALMLTQTAADDKGTARSIAEYLVGESASGAGIRRFPYSFDMAVNPLTLDDFNHGNEVHDAGEIWASALWDMNWLLIDKHGFDSDVYTGSGGNNVALQLVMDGLKLQPPNPSFVDARDAILMADTVLTGGENQSEIWTAFARRGLGFAADDGGSSNATRVVESFAPPPAPAGTIALNKDVYEINETVDVVVLDSDLVGSNRIEVLATATNGDQEVLSLAEEGSFGVFRGSLAFGSDMLAGDGRLRAGPGDTITVTYVDADDGTGNLAEVSATANVIALIDIFSATFEGVDNEAEPQGFTADGQWHLSRGRGLVQLDSNDYLVGDRVTVTVGDVNLPNLDSVSVQMRSTAGDQELVRLNALGGGFFRGSIAISADPPVAGNGVLEVVVGSRIAVQYDDPDDGSGSAVTVTDNAVILPTPIEVFRADFTSADMQPDSEGFTTEGIRNDWHLSKGRADHAGHSSPDSYYFGRGERADGRGLYRDGADARLTSPVIDLRRIASGATLSSNQLLVLEEFFDVATVSILSDGRRTEIANSNEETLPRSTPFAPLSFDLSDFIGREIQVQFGFQSDSGETREGWYVDDVVVTGRPVGPRGQIRLDRTSYEAGQDVIIAVADADLAEAETIQVLVQSGNGDSEQATLSRVVSGLYRGTIRLTSGQPVGNSVLELNDSRDHITITYLDEDNGAGTSATVVSRADTLTLTEVLRADFSDASGAPSPDGFSSGGQRNLWHLSLGRDVDPGHSPGGNFYFGKGEGLAGGGRFTINTNGTLISPVINLSQLDEVVVLEFNHLLDLDDFGDVARVSVIVAGLPTEIASTDSFSFDFESSVLSPTTVFTHVRLDVSQFAGKQIQLQFEFVADDFGTGEGWYVDDVVLKGLRISRRGEVLLDGDLYEVGLPVGIQVKDRDLTGLASIEVLATSSVGDVETVRLTALGGGRFGGSLDTSGGPVAANGVLEVAAEGTLAVTYEDRNDGTGAAGTREVTARLRRPRVILLQADFSDDDGAPIDEGFTSSGSNNQWHLSTGRSTTSGHTPPASFYFGSSENTPAGGRYANNAEGTLLSPVIDLRGIVGNVTLSFNHYLQISDDFWDEALINVLVDGQTDFLSSSFFWLFRRICG